MCVLIVLRWLGVVLLQVQVYGDQPTVLFLISHTVLTNTIEIQVGFGSDLYTLETSCFINYNSQDAQALQSRLYTLHPASYARSLICIPLADMPG